jgi:ABC-type uncharacterized transport system ATPase subunit
MIRLIGITKIFPGVVANRNISLEFRAGEVHALLGENGAGKSTLMNIVGGVYEADAGEMQIDGVRVRLSSPMRAIEAGIGMVHQHFKLVQALTVAENIHLGWKSMPLFASRAAMAARTRKLSSRFCLPVSPEARVADLSAGEQQRVELLRVLARGARVLLLDEPTAVLTAGEADNLFEAVRRLRDEGNAVILISHKLDDVMRVSDRISVLRNGSLVATVDAQKADVDQLATLMIGSPVRTEPDAGRGLARAPRSRLVLRAAGIEALSDRGLPALEAVDLEVREGEIVGVAGVAGNGQLELSEVLTGLRPLTLGQILIDDKPMQRHTPRAFRDAGVGHIPEDRLRTGVAAALSITENAVLREYGGPPVGGRWSYRTSAARRLAHAIVERAAVQAPNLSMPFRNLSGGNQQRVVAQREIRIARRLLVAANPTRGLDLGAAAALMRAIETLRDRGVAVILISEEIDELLTRSDRIVVMYGGRVMESFNAHEANAQAIGLRMGGRHAVSGHVS